MSAAISKGETARPARFVASGESADIAVVIVSYNSAHVIERCLNALRAASSELRVRTYVVDNASSDESLDVLRRNHADCVLIDNVNNVGFGRANNQVIAATGAPFVLLLNPDAYVAPDALQVAFDYMREHPKCGVLGADLLGEDGRRGNPLRPFPSPWKNFLRETGFGKWFGRPHPDELVASVDHGVQRCDWITGCFYMIRAEVIAKIGGFDPRYFLYFEEVDHCKAVHEAGWDVECHLDAKVIHVGGESAKSAGEDAVKGRQVSALQIESELLYFRKHGGLLLMMSAVCLGLLTDAILWIKAVLRRRDASWPRRHAVTMLRLLNATRMGLQPTR